MNRKKSSLLIFLLVTIFLLGGCCCSVDRPLTEDSLDNNLINPSIIATIPSDPTTEPPQAESAPTESPRQNADIDIDALNALLIGVRYSSDHTGGDVSNWSDEAICDAIYGKLLWDLYGSYSDSPYLSKVDLQYRTSDDMYEHFDMKAIDKITQDAFGQTFPIDTGSEHILVFGDELLVMPATGESTELVIQEAAWQGERILAVGTAVHHNNADSYFLGYFEAVFEANPSSIYGYTLVSLREINGNQNFDKLVATASSELKETQRTHYAKNVLDGSLSTAWVEGVSGVGVNQWIKLETPDGAKMKLAAIGFAMGYQKSDAHLAKNGFPTKILIECEDGYRQEWQFYYYDDTALLDRSVTTSWVKITILEATAGTEYKDTCISEIDLYGIGLPQ